MLSSNRKKSLNASKKDAKSLDNNRSGNALNIASTTTFLENSQLAQDLEHIR